MKIDPEKYDFARVRVTAEHPTVKRLLDRFLHNFNLPQTSPAGRNWWALTSDDRIVTVFAFASRPDGSLEVTDLYSVPDRLGVAGMYYILEYAKALVDAKRVPYIVTSTLTNNFTIKRRMREIIGEHAVPLLEIYQYPNNQVREATET